MTKDPKTIAEEIANEYGGEFACPKIALADAIATALTEAEERGRKAAKSEEEKWEKLRGKCVLADQELFEDLQGKLERMRAVLAPIATSFKSQGDRYRRVQSNWFAEMPDHWEINIIITMQQGRAAAAMLDELKKGTA